MKSPTPKNIKPGTWLRTNPEDVGDYPDAIYRCKKFKWVEDYSPKNIAVFEIVIDSLNGDLKEWDLKKDLGNSWSWEEIMPTLFVYEDKREVIKNVIENPIKRG